MLSLQVVLSEHCRYLCPQVSFPFASLLISISPDLFKYCIKRVGMTSLTSILRKACLQGWPLAGFWELRIGWVPTICQAHCTWTMQTRWSMLNTCFPSGMMAFWYMPGTGCLHDQSPINTLGTESPVSFPGRHFGSIISTCCWGS